MAALAAGEIEPYRAQTIKPVQAQVIKPTEAQTIKPFEAQTIKPIEAQVIKPMPAQPMALPQAKPAEGGSQREAQEWLARGRQYLDAQRYSEAVEAFTKALELRQDYAAALVGRGIAFRHLREPERAIRDYDRVIAVNSEDRVAYYNRALVYRDQGNNQLFEQDVRTSARLGFPQAQNLLAGIEKQRMPVDSGAAPAPRPASPAAVRGEALNGTKGAAPRPAAAKSDGSEVAGTWYGVAGTVGTLVLDANGSYNYNGNPGGRFKRTSAGIDFSGALEAWGGGHATLKGGNLEFYWTAAGGGKNWFAFSR